MHYNNILDIKELFREERYFSLSLTLLTLTDFSSRPIRGAWMSDMEKVSKTSRRKVLDVAVGFYAQT